MEHQPDIPPLPPTAGTANIAFRMDELSRDGLGEAAADRPSSGNGLMATAAYSIVSIALVVLMLIGIGHNF